MAEFLVEQFLLHATPYKETSALVTGFSRELGKVRYVAKGVYGKNNKYKGLTQPFTLFSCRLQGNGELKSSFATEALERAVPLQGNALYCAMYCNEVLVRVLPPEEPNQALFDFYQQTLNQLSLQENPEPILREFELFLLQEMGAAYDFGSDATSAEPVVEEYVYDYVPEYGFTRAGSSRRQQQFYGADLLAIGQLHWTPDSLKAAKRFTRLALSPFLGNKPLKSRELFQKP